MEILFLLIVLVVLFLAVFSSRKEQTSAADNRKDSFQKEQLSKLKAKSKITVF